MTISRQVSISPENKARAKYKRILDDLLAQFVMVNYEMPPSEEEEIRKKREFYENYKMATRPSFADRLRVPPTGRKHAFTQEDFARLSIRLKK